MFGETYKSLTMLKLNDKRFNRLKVLRYAYSKDKRTYWECKCDCGNIKIAEGSGLMKKDIESCGCLRRNLHSKRPYEWLYNSITRYLKQRKYHDFVSNVMSYEDFVAFTKITECHYCKHPIQWNDHTTYAGQQIGRTTKYNLDRKDNNIGYTKDNCVVCCTLCNYVKGKTLTYDEMLIVGKSIAEVHKKRATITTDCHSCP
jgi:hypothetical protein